MSAYTEPARQRDRADLVMWVRRGCALIVAAVAASYDLSVTYRCLKRDRSARVGVNVGYARCSTDRQDLTAQREQLGGLGVPADRIYLDEGLTGTNRARPGLDQALAAVRAGDTFTVTKLDRLDRSVPDALDILGQLSDRGVRFALGASVYDWNDPFGRMFLQILAVVAEFEAHPRGHGHRQGQGQPAGQTAQAQTWAGPRSPTAATTPSSRSPKCSTSPAPPCTAPSNASPDPTPHQPKGVKPPSATVADQLQRLTLHLAVASGVLGRVVIGPLTLLLAENPLNEPLALELMRAPATLRPPSSAWEPSEFLQALQRAILLGKPPFATVSHHG